MTFPVVSLCKKGFSTKEFDQNKIQSTKFCWEKKFKLKQFSRKELVKRNFGLKQSLSKKKLKDFSKQDLVGTILVQNNLVQKSFGPREIWLKN